MRESKVESHFRKVIKSLGGIAYKFVSPQRRGVPDRLVLLPIPEEHKETVSKYFYFCELKAPGKKPRADQLREHDKIKKLGFVVKVVDKLIE